MLRASAHHTGCPVDLTAIARPESDSRLPAGRELLDFVTALIGTGDDLPASRGRLSQLVGVTGLIRAAAVAGNFEMMNRLVDATGVPIGATLRAIEAELDLPG